MKKFYLLLLTLLFFTFAKAQYSHQNISLVSHWYDPAQVAEPVYGIKYNSIWGWVNPKTNVEYAILGSGSGTYIVDLSTPSLPKKVAFVAGRRDSCIWREYKTYKNYLYAISDDGAPNSFQIIDMSYLPDSVHVVYDLDTMVQRAHTLFIDGDKLYMAAVKPTSTHGRYSMAVYSLVNPERPSLLRYLNQDDPAIDDVHDMLVRNDTVYASCGFKGLFIYLYDAVANKFKAINSIGFYPNQGYNHSSALTPDGHTLVFCDEVPRNLPVKIADVTDIQNISFDTTFRSAIGPTPHNPYIRDPSHVVIAYYQDGLQIFDISNTKHPVRTGYFDTDTIDGPGNFYDTAGTAYHGCWGSYIKLPSKLILASDMQNGLFVLDASIALAIKDNGSSSLSAVTLYPNPANSSISLQFNLLKAESFLIEVTDMAGRRLFSKSKNEPAGIVTQTIPLDIFDKGIYVMRISGRGISHSSKFIKN